jgi:hypothetical protein
MKIRAVFGLGVVLVLAALAASSPASASPPGTVPLYYVGTVDRFLVCPGSTSFAGDPVSGFASASASASGGTVNVAAVVRHATPNVDYPIYVFELDASGGCLDIELAGTFTTNGSGFGFGSGSATLVAGATQVQVALNPGEGCLCANFETAPIPI